MKIKPQKYGAWSEADRLELVKLLAKAGYTVRIGKEKDGNRAAVYYVEFCEEKKNADT